MTKDLILTGLPRTPGWTSLSPEKQRWLQQETSDALEHRQMSGVHALAEAAKLYSIEQGLKYEKMSMRNFFLVAYQGSYRNGRQKLKQFKALLDKWGMPALTVIQAKGGDLLRGSNVALGDLQRVSLALPAPKSTEPKVIEAWVEGPVRKHLTQDRQDRHKKRPKARDEDNAIKVWVTIGARLMREAKLATSAEQRAFLKRACGYLMERRAISGSVTITRTPIPDDFFPRLGRPPLNPDNED